MLYTLFRPVFDDNGKFAYTQSNTTVHAFVESLERLLLRLDGIESEGSVEVKDRRRAVVKAVEKELERVESWKVAEWQRLSAAKQSTAGDVAVLDQSASEKPASEMEVDPKPVDGSIEEPINIPISSSAPLVDSATAEPAVDSIPTVVEASEPSTVAPPASDAIDSSPASPAITAEALPESTSINLSTLPDSDSVAEQPTAALQEAGEVASGPETVADIADAGDVLVDLSDEEEGSAEDFVVVDSEQ